MKKFIHIDMDCFYAAVEMRDFPELRGRPLAVGGKELQRGVVSTCNYEARAFGVRSAMPTAKALNLCPELIVIPGRMTVYRLVSEQIRQIFAHYTDLIEPLSLDEAYLDVTECELFRGSATLMAEAIRTEIYQTLQLTASAGVAPLKFLAKVASDVNKPNGLCVIAPDKMQEFIDALPLGKIPGVGKVAIEKLNQNGYFTCLDIRQADYLSLLRTFGRLGNSLWQKSHGMDDSEVIPHRERKSVGVERTLERNISSFDECWSLIELQLYPELVRRMQQLSEKRNIIKQGIKIKFADFQQTTIEHLQNQLDLGDFRVLLSDILARQHGREIRLIGLNVSLKPLEQDKQLSFF